MHRRYYTFLVFAILLLLASVSSAQQIIIDHTADGSQYELAMPAAWNGNLVVYAHGIVDPQAPTGKLKIPVVTLHTTRDPVVPIWHEDLYRALADKAGSGNLLVQTSVEAYGHCNFTDAETFTAFAKLVTWVETGVKPAP